MNKADSVKDCKAKVMKVTLSVIKADVGGFVGHSGMHPALMDLAGGILEKEKDGLIDYRVMHCGDDLELIMTHTKGIDNKEIHGLAWKIFEKCTEKAKELKLYGAGQDILKTAFSGTLKGMGPGIAEMSFEERPSEPIIIFMADKTEPGAWNLPLYKMFADPFSTAGLVIDPKLHHGFTFEVHDVVEHKRVFFKLPEDIYDLLTLIGQTGRFVIKRVKRNLDNETASISSTQRLSLIAGKYCGKDDPVLIVRTQSGFVAVGEALVPFAFPYMVAGWCRGSHHGPIMPVSFKNARCTNFDGPPRVIAAGFQLNNGKLEGPVDLFDDPAFDWARNKANEIADYIRRMGPFSPAIVGPDELEYTTLPEVLKKLNKKWLPVTLADE